MKVLISVGGFTPAKNYGGPVVSINNLCKLLADSDTEFYVLTVDHDLKSSERMEGIQEGWNEHEYCKVMYLRETEVNRKNIEKIILDVAPDIMYLSSLFLAKFTIPFLQISAKHKIPLLLAPRGELSSCFAGRYKKIPYMFVLRPLLRMPQVYFQATSDDEKQSIMKYLQPDASKIFFLSNVPDTTTVVSSKSTKVKGKLSCVFLSRIHKKKNILGALKILQQCQGEIMFDIYGPKEVPEYWEECEKLIDAMPKNITVKYCGTVEHTEVKNTIAKYDLFLFPTFGENYGHAIIEALQAGTPALISDQTPWLDLEQYNAGWAYPLDSEQPFIDCINQAVISTPEEYDLKSAAAQNYVLEKLKINELKEAYLEAFLSINNN